jgi:hypothetical protein
VSGIEARVWLMIRAAFDSLVSALVRDPERACKHRLGSFSPASVTGGGALTVIVDSVLHTPLPRQPPFLLLLLTVAYLGLGTVLANHVLSPSLASPALRHAAALSVTLASAPWVVFGRRPDAVQAVAAVALGLVLGFMAWAGLF